MKTPYLAMLKLYGGLIGFIILAFALQGCALHYGAPAYHVPAVKGYVDGFEAFYKRDVSRISITFGDKLPKDAVGVCYGRTDVVLENAYWGRATDLQRKALVWHELGHCAMGWGHDDTIEANQCPSSFMYPFVMGDYCLADIFNEMGIKTVMDLGKNIGNSEDNTNVFIDVRPL